LDTFVSILLSGLITGLTVLVGAYAIFKLAWPNIKKQVFEALLDESTLENALQMAINNEKLQKFLYEAGGLVAAGAKSGFGLPGGKGKTKIEDILLGLVGGFVQSKLPQIANANQASQQSLNPQTTEKVGY